ncbi:MAG TPA: MlaD family protein [Gemmatimonadota bacterium]|jgi:phospholipid/cholesterol/gamma-HCH transport system substrate-binding protein
MKRGETLRLSQVKVGIMLVVGFVILVWVAFNSDLPSLFKSKRGLAARFPSAEGLPAGAPVFFLGMEAGTVESVEFDPEGGDPPIIVTFNVREGIHQRLRADAFVRISSFGILGDKYLELLRGSVPEALPEGAVLPGRSAESFTDLVEPGRRALTKVDGLLTELETISIGLRDGKGTAGKLLTDEDVHDRLVTTLDETRAALADFRKTQRDMGEQLTSAASSIASTAGSFDSLATDWRTGQGTINRLAEDPSLYENLNAATARLDRVLAEVERGDGLLARLLKDPEFANQVTGLVVDLRALLVDMREHPGRYVQFSVF